MEKISYRYANINDIDQLVELRILMQIEVNFISDQISPELKMNYHDLVKTYLKNKLTNEDYICAVAVSEQGKILATAGVCFYQKPPSITGGTGMVGYVTNVYTCTSHRRQGIGRELIKRLNEKAQEKKADKLHLGATSDGVNIYRNIGYKEPRFINLEIKF